MRNALALGFLVVACVPQASAPATAAEKPNVVLIVCDDLNDYIEALGGHPQAQTPNITRLCESGVCFTEAHCTIPICAPSRSSFLTGLYPHTSCNFGFDRWDKNKILLNSRTIMDHFRAAGYHTLGTGKLMHHLRRQEWEDWGNRPDYGPFAFDGTDRVAHPDVPAPYRDIGPVDGSFGPLENLAERTFADGKSYSWQTGNWRGMRTLHVTSDEDRDRTADELNGKWAVDRLRELANRPQGKPFFMGVGFIRPHTPLIVPKRFFDQFPVDSIQLPVIRPGDVEDTYARSVRGIPDGKEELYHDAADPYEWDNLADNGKYAAKIEYFRNRLKARLPKTGTAPRHAANESEAKAAPKNDAKAWKDSYFAKHPEADADKDGELTWPELKAYREKHDPPPEKPRAEHF